MSAAEDRICLECGAPATERHHVVPVQFGGTKTLPFCSLCHARAHGFKNGGRPLGRPPGVPEDVKQRILTMYRNGMTTGAIARLLDDQGVPTVSGGRWRSNTIQSIAVRAGLPPRPVGTPARAK